MQVPAYKLGSYRGTERKMLFNIVCFSEGQRGLRVTWTVWEETFLPVQFLLAGGVDMCWWAGVDRDLPALLVAHLLTVRSLRCLAVVDALHLAGEGVRHPGLRHRLRLVVPQLLTVLTHNLRDDELHLLGHQLALLPGHGLALLSPGPDLLPVLVSLPVGNAV